MAGNGSSLFSLSCRLDELCHIVKMIFIDFVDVLNYAGKLCKVCPTSQNKIGLSHQGIKIQGLLPLFWGPALHIPFKIFCNPSKRKG